MARKKKEFVFSKHDEIGAADASEDNEYLSECFINTGDLTLIKNPTNRKVIILGRTGTGKTALLTKLKEEIADRVIEIDPEDLALSYISNSRVINFFDSIGVNLDPFFKLLWRHVFFLQVFKVHYEVSDERRKKSVFARLQAEFGRPTLEDRNTRKALDYIEKWSGRFWESSQCLAKEIAQKFEKELESSASGSGKSPIFNIGGSVKGNVTYSEEEKLEMRELGQRIVSDAQVEDIKNIDEICGNLFDDPQKCYYVIIDRLDLNWVEDKIRYKLIMALVDTAKEFVSVDNIKVMFAMRRDLIDRVFRLTRSMGFQEEKYTSLYLPLHWTKNDMISLLNARLSALVSKKTSPRKVTYDMLIPKKIKKENIDDYIYARARRPRDIIDFFNRCIHSAENKSRIDVADIKSAEGEYSYYRLRSLGDEWNSDYPSLLDFTEILVNKPSSFKVSVISEQEIEDICLKVAYENINGQGLLQLMASAQVNGIHDAKTVRSMIIQAFYRIGLVGVKPDTYHKPNWSDDWQNKGYVLKADITDDASVVIHPAYYRALGTIL